MRYALLLPVIRRLVGQVFRIAILTTSVKMDECW